MTDSTTNEGNPITREQCERFATKKLIELFSRTTELSPEDKVALGLTVDAIVEASLLYVKEQLLQASDTKSRASHDV